jgi:hypothetical protein
MAISGIGLWNFVQKGTFSVQKVTVMVKNIDRAFTVVIEDQDSMLAEPSAKT